MGCGPSTSLMRYACIEEAAVLLCENGGTVKFEFYVRGQEFTVALTAQLRTKETTKTLQRIVHVNMALYQPAFVELVNGSDRATLFFKIDTEALLLTVHMKRAASSQDVDDKITANAGRQALQHTIALKDKRLEVEKRMLDAKAEEHFKRQKTMAERHVSNKQIEFGQYTVHQCCEKYASVNRQYFLSNTNLTVSPVLSAFTGWRVRLVNATAEHVFYFKADARADAERFQQWCTDFFMSA